MAVLGSGSWGTALAVHLAREGHDVRLWGRNPALVDEIRATGTNATYLSGVVLPANVALTHAVDRAVIGADFVVCAVPTHGARSVLRLAVPHIAESTILVSATKGLEVETLLRMSEVIQQEISRRPVVVLSGPSFAGEVARELPTAIVAASSSADAAKAVQEGFRGRAFRLYASDDVVGVEIGAALKNVIAIAAGVVEGLGLGHNALAALITRGLAEISRLAGVLGARRDTLSGLAGLGDLVLTCTGNLSRNRHVGIELGRGRPLDQVLAEMKMVAEGVRTTTAALALGARHGVELPIAAQMAEVLAGRAHPAAAVERLMLRPQRAEADGLV